MFDYETWHRTYSGVLSKMATGREAELGELEAKAVPQRWFTDYGGYTAWDGEPFPNLDAWADGGPHADEINRSVLIAEAERMLREVTDPALSKPWHREDIGSQETATAAVRALIRYLREEPTYQSVAQRIYTDDSADIAISEGEAKIIAAGWAGDHYCPRLAQWVDGRDDIPRAELAAEARQLVDDLSLHRDSWPHEGEPGPNIAAVAALIDHLTAERG
ncbi:hypothetical protein [Nocardia sp. CY41]|uniref:hypothetical protein n=1 Tax=Nocardia sp. CY41 TaxID=2608686 RepID=UPI0013599174|nr:hypothetical protein [Nocardia sp. CY41]